MEGRFPDTREELCLADDRHGKGHGSLELTLLQSVRVMIGLFNWALECRSRYAFTRSQPSGDRDVVETQLTQK